MKQSNSFKSFTEIVNLEPNKKVLDFIIDCDKYLAHTHSNHKSETLEEHLRLVIEYFLSIVKVNRLDKIIDNLILAILENQNVDSERIGNYLKKLFYSSILYHDVGKVNHLFQLDPKKMNNLRDDFRIVNHNVSTHHSIISTYIFLIHFFDDENFDDNERSLLDYFVTLFAYPIKQHHSSILLDRSDLNFKEQETHFKDYLDLFTIPLNSNLHDLHDLINDTQTTFKQFEQFKINEFPVFALIKLNYSLLTASDYYATNHYMSGLKKPYDAFGTIDDRLLGKIIRNFKSLKTYNADLIDRKTYYRGFEHKNLLNPTNDNLNILRQKLGVEIIDGLEKYLDKKVFYIEAPTGGGKTNLSIIAIVELLKKFPDEITKIFYVFPFTTLITQTIATIKDTLGLDNTEIIELHSKAGFHSKEENDEDGVYGDKKENYIDNQFVNYPFCLLSHISFFDILKTNQKDVNYLVHRLANSIVVIDELQSYSPNEWDKVKYFISNYAELFNIRFILMSATLPKIGSIAVGNNIEFQPLINEAQKNYLQNPNFKDRVNFDFTLLKKYPKINNEDLTNEVLEKSKEYALENEKFDNSVHTIIEFIFKKSATEFYNQVKSNDFFDEIFVLSGTILEPRRRFIINFLKDKKNRSKKILLITTQVVEAGVDIDMDLGFKNISLLDSDEQLAGRINRNVNKDTCKLYLFFKDEPFRVYKDDIRYKLSASIYKNEQERSAILEGKDYKKLYDLVIERIDEDNNKVLTESFNDYKALIKHLKFTSINEEFRLIKNETISIFVPLNIPLKWVEYPENPNFSNNELKFLKEAKCLNEISKEIIGKNVWELYVSSIKNKNKAYIERAIDLKVINGIMSKFVFSIYSTNNVVDSIKSHSIYDSDLEDYRIYGFYCLSDISTNTIYHFEAGLDEYKMNCGEIW